MRTLLPDRLLEPMIPIVNPRVIAQGKTMPKSPQVLYERLSKTARDGVAEVSDFRTMWTSPELKEVWEHVDARVRENNGQLLQPTGTWERDYDILLETLAKDEQAQKDEQERAAEETDRTQSAEGNWRTVVEGFAQKNVPGVRVAPSRSRNAVTVTLAKAGMAFDVQLGSADGSWVVSNKPSVLSPEKPATKLETAICAYLNTRPRQWDLAFLLVSFLLVFSSQTWLVVQWLIKQDMIASYSTIKQTPCAKCTKMTDATAQLPTIRHPKVTPGQTTFTFEPYHPGCA